MMRAYIPIHDRHGTPGLSETRTRLHIRYGIEFSHERGGRGHVIRPRTRSTAEPRTPSTTTRGQATQMTAKITTCEARVPPKRPANTRTHTHTWWAGELQPGKGGRTGPKVRSLRADIRQMASGGASPGGWGCLGGLRAVGDAQFELGRLRRTHAYTGSKERSEECLS
jgi:hypothetical protein